MKQFGSGGPMGGSMADIEAQLEELSSSELSGTAGGVMTYFLWWDLGVFVLLVRPTPTQPRALAPSPTSGPSPPPPRPPSTHCPQTAACAVHLRTK